MTEPDHLTWVGHATVLVDLDGVRLLTDPFLRARPLHLRRYAPPPDPDALARLDAILISHVHLDHLDLPSLRRLGAGVPVIVPTGAGAFLRRAGFADVREIAEGETAHVGALELAAVHAEHDAHRRPRGPVAEPLGYAIHGSRRVYFAGDTSVFEEMRRLRQPRVDVALLPIWGWGPSLGPGHMDPEEAARAVALIAPAVVVPIHWGTYFPQGRSRGRRLMAFAQPPRVFVERVAALAPDTQVRVLAPGATLALGPVAVS